MVSILARATAHHDEHDDSWPGYEKMNSRSKEQTDTVIFRTEGVICVCYSIVQAPYKKQHIETMTLMANILFVTTTAKACNRFSFIHGIPPGRYQIAVSMGSILAL